MRFVEFEAGRFCKSDVRIAPLPRKMQKTSDVDIFAWVFEKKRTFEREISMKLKFHAQIYNS